MTSERATEGTEEICCSKNPRVPLSSCCAWPTELVSVHSRIFIRVLCSVNQAGFFPQTSLEVFPTCAAVLCGVVTLKLNNI